MDAAGAYTAPTAPGTYHVVATSQADPSKTAVATVTVQPSIVVTPGNATVAVGDTQTFTATVRGQVGPPVTWSVQEGASGGAVAADGVYTAPGTAGTYHVTVRSASVPGETATAAIVVQAGNASGIIR